MIHERIVDSVMDDIHDGMVPDHVVFSMNSGVLTEGAIDYIKKKALEQMTPENMQAAKNFALKAMREANNRGLGDKAMKLAEAAAAASLGPAGPYLVREAAKQAKAEMNRNRLLE